MSFQQGCQELGTRTETDGLRDGGREANRIYGSFADAASHIFRLGCHQLDEDTAPSAPPVSGLIIHPPIDVGWVVAWHRDGAGVVSSKFQFVCCHLQRLEETGHPTRAADRALTDIHTPGSHTRTSRVKRIVMKPCRTEERGSRPIRTDDSGV